MASIEQGSPEWWVIRLSKKLDEQARAIRVFDDYYSGNHKLGFATPKFKRAFGDLFKAFADNWCAIIVDSVDERLNVEGFRYKDDNGDKKAWDIWQANELDADSQLVHSESLINSVSFVSVWYSDKDASKPVISVEHPSECYVETAPGSRKVRTAAIKRWLEDDGHVYATVYLPDGLYKFKSQAAYTNGIIDAQSLRWVPREVDGEAWPVPNPFAVVPVIPFVNRPRMIGGGISEIHDAIPIQDAVNKTILDMMVASEFIAAPQRYATGLEIPKDENGKPLPVFDHLVDRMMVSTSSDTEFGQFPQANLDSYVKATEMLVQHLASQSRTPPHYFYLSGQFPSGESIKSAETGLVAKVRRRQRHFGESWEEVMRLAFTVAGDKGRSQEEATETIWADPESRSESEHVDAIMKKKALDVPTAQLWEDLGYSPQQIDRFQQMKLQEQLLAGGDTTGIDTQAAVLQKIYLAVGKIITTDEARSLARKAGIELSDATVEEVFASLPPSPSPANPAQ